MLQVAYVGNEARHLLRERRISTSRLSQRLPKLAPAGDTINQVRPVIPASTDITQYRSDGTSNYNAFQLSASKTKGIRHRSDQLHLRECSRHRQRPDR